MSSKPDKEVPKLKPAIVSAKEFAEQTGIDLSKLQADLDALVDGVKGQVDEEE